MLLGIDHVGTCRTQNFVLLRIHRNQMESGGGQIDATDVEKMSAVGQKPGKTMRGCVGWSFQHRDGPRRTARRGDALKRCPVRGREDNHALLAPASAPAA